MPSTVNSARLKAALLAAFSVAVVLSALGRQSFGGWLTEAFLILAGAAVLVVTHDRVTFSDTTYCVLFAFGIVVLTGARYTYADVPLGDWMKRAFGFQRNHFDRIGHFMQGAGPALLMRELIARPGERRSWTLFLQVAAIVLGVSAFFELLEWQYAVIGHGTSVEFLGAQGDPWDTQADMCMALAGAAAAQVLVPVTSAVRRSVEEPALAAGRPAPHVVQHRAPGQ